MSSDRDDLIRLGIASSISLATYEELLRRFGSTRAILQAGEAELCRLPRITRATARKISTALSEVNLGKEKASARKLDVRILTYQDADYPANLKLIPDPPLVLYVKGTIQSEDQMAIAMVGARRCSYYGRKQAERLAGGLARLGFTVTSGMARGIDSCCHQGALNAGGRTIAVLGNGLATVYPPENEKLFQRILERGAVVSELPMYAPPLADHFPRRNRIISGLGLGVVVVEASTRSGSLITARWALEQGKEVFAVPGKIDSPYSKGCHQLIKDGAKLVEDVTDITEELGELAEVLPDLAEEAAEDRPELPLSPDERKIFNLLSSEPKHIDELARETGLSAAKVSATLMSLELKKVARQLPGKLFVRM